MMTLNNQERLEESLKDFVATPDVPRVPVWRQEMEFIRKWGGLYTAPDTKKKRTLRDRLLGRG